jgi:hypothetical protein
LPLSARETVAVETPASFATSSMPAMVFPANLSQKLKTLTNYRGLTGYSIGSYQRVNRRTELD